MILIASKEEKELIRLLRGPHSAVELSSKLIALQREVEAAEIDKSKLKEEHAREERELRHMIGLEKKRQEFEIKKATEEATLKVREENLNREKRSFEDNLKFNTERFEKMESYMKDMMADILKRLPNVNMEISQQRRK